MELRPPSIAQHLISILVLPFMVLVVIPASILKSVKLIPFDPFLKLNGALTNILGGILLIIGLLLLITSIILFIRIGKGTLAPWNPTQKLVVKGLYRYVRNPMILGVIITLLAESLLFRSNGILLWALFFFGTSHLYFVLSEEPGLVKRFGDEYKTYKANVPRWLPRRKGWRPEDH